MSAAKITPIGGKTKICGKWYQKVRATHVCEGCAFQRLSCPGAGTLGPIEENGSECESDAGSTIWIDTVPPSPKKAKASKATWTWTAKWLPEMSIRTTKRQIRDHLEIAIMELNALGTENAKLKNAIARMKRSAR